MELHELQLAARCFPLLCLPLPPFLQSLVTMQDYLVCTVSRRRGIAWVCLLQLHANNCMHAAGGPAQSRPTACPPSRPLLPR